MRVERVAMTRIAETLDAILRVLAKSDDIAPDPAHPEPTQIDLFRGEPEPEPSQTISQLREAVRSLLVRYKEAGGNHIQFVESVVGLPLKANEMDEAELIMLLNHDDLK